MHTSRIIPIAQMMKQTPVGRAALPITGMGQNWAQITVLFPSIPFWPPGLHKRITQETLFPGNMVSGFQIKDKRK